MNTLFCVGNTHFDPVWLWRWEEAMASILSTFRSALDRMDEDPEFHYSFSTPPVFEWVKRVDPALWERIRQRMLEGRWEAAEGWWLQPDCYSGQGESYIRQGLLGQRWLKENLGFYAKTVFNIDSFGHPNTLPQLLKKSGVSNYVTCRPEPKFVELPSPRFIWQGTDGSWVEAYRSVDPYSKALAGQLEEMSAADENRMVVFGVTNHGGAPVKRDLETIRERENARCATIEEFFAATPASNVVTQELLTGDFGPYANHIPVKADNRDAEFALLNAEAVSVLTGEDHRETLKKAWQDVCFNQFHDILGGACIREAYRDTAQQVGRATANAEEITRFGLQKLTNRLQMPGKNGENAWNVVLWNLNGADWKGLCEAEVQWLHEFPAYTGQILLEDADGNRVRCQSIPAKAVIAGFRTRFVFPAEIPAMGCRAYKVIQTGEPFTDTVQRPTERIDSERFCFEFDERGLLRSVREKKSGKLLLSDVCLPRALADEGDTWAFNIDAFGPVLEPFTGGAPELLEDGPVRTVLSTKLRFRDSLLELRWVIPADADWFEVRYRVNWNETHTALKLTLPVEDPAHTAAVPAGKVRRGEAAAERPLGGWLQTAGPAVAADRIFCYSMAGGELGLTVLRSGVFGDLRLEELWEHAGYDYTGQGVHEGTIRLWPAGTDRPEEKTAAFLNPPRLVIEANHSGSRPEQTGALRLEAENAVVTALKPWEDGEGVVVRLLETGGIRQPVRLTFRGERYETELLPAEVATLLLRNGKAEKVNLLEDVGAEF